MSELSLNVAPTPELLKTAAGASPPAAPGRGPAGTGEAAGAPNPFAALLSGVLQGAQPAPEGAAPGAGTPAYAQLAEAQLQPEASTAGASVLGLPGTAAAPPGITDKLPEVVSGRPAGNPLPGTGKELPLELAGTRTATETGQPIDPASDAETVPPAASRSRVFLADLALSRPLEPATALPAATTGDSARTATAAALAGRALTPGNAGDGERSTRAGDQARGLAPLAYSGGISGSAGLTGAGDGLVSGAPAGGDDASLRFTVAELFVRSAGLPGAGTEILTGQLAAFAASSDRSTGTALSALTGTGTPDAGSAALLSRLGSTGLPPLQPLADAGAFAGGLADRLLTLAGPGAHSARLKLHPEHLGELNVEINIEDGNAQVWFGTTSSQARDAIEGSLPRLRELFADQGIQLTRTQVDAGGGQMGDSGFGQERRMTGGAGEWNAAPAWQRGDAAAGTEPAGGNAASGSARLLDVWA